MQVHHRDTGDGYGVGKGAAQRTHFEQS